MKCIAEDLVAVKYLLSGLECKFVVLSSICSIDLREVKSLWEEIVDESTEGDAVGPRRGEILNLDILKS